MPGKPPPLPRSAHWTADGARLKSCSESEICRVHRFGSVDGAIKFVFACHSSSRSTYRCSRPSVSRETGVSFSAAARSEAEIGEEACFDALAILLERRHLEVRASPASLEGC